MSLPSTWSCVRPAAARCVPSATRAAFSTTAPSRSNSNGGRGRVPPESPSFIRLPKVPQSTESKPERVRGTLPVPREVFSRADGDRKVRPEYMEQTAPRRTRERTVDNESQRWKKSMADSRRQNLEEGLQSLWERRETKEARRAEKLRRQQEAFRRAQEAPERRVDLMARGTILESIHDTSVAPDPERFEKAERGRANVLAQAGARREARRDALMELYINASDFIVTEAELKEEVEKVFSEDYFTKQSKQYRPGATANVWGIEGKPPGIASMLENLTRTSTNLARANESEFDHSVKRTKRISEEFTGGKMI